jgi:hypothetical protein
VALYNVMEDPAEKTDLSTALPEVFRALRQGKHFPEHLTVLEENSSQHAKIFLQNLFL